MTKAGVKNWNAPIMPVIMAKRMTGEIMGRVMLIEAAPSIGTIDGRCFIEFSRHSLQTGQEDDHRAAGSP